MKRFIIFVTVIILSMGMASSTGMAGGGKGYTVKIISPDGFRVEGVVQTSNRQTVFFGADSNTSVTVNMPPGDCPYAILNVTVFGPAGKYYVNPSPAIFSAASGFASCKDQIVTVLKQDDFRFYLTWQ